MSTPADLQAADNHIAYLATTAGRFIVAVNNAFEATHIPTPLTAEVFAARAALIDAIGQWARPSYRTAGGDTTL